MKLRLTPSSSAEAGVGLSMAKMSVGTSVYFEEQHQVIGRDTEWRECDEKGGRDRKSRGIDI